MKRLFKFLLFLVLLVVVVLGATLFLLDKIVKKGVETAGPVLTDTPVTLDKVSLSPLSGKGRLYNFQIDNPEGFETQNAIRAGKVEVVVDPSTLMQEKVVVRSIHVNQPEVTFEIGKEGNNLGRLLQNINEAVNQLPQGKEPAGEAEQSAAKKLQVDDFLISGGQINVSAEFLKGKSISVPLPEVHLTNLGQGPEGITAAELAQRIFAQLLAGSTQAAGEKLKSLDLDIDLNSLKEKLEGRLPEILGEGSKVLEGGAEKLKEGLKGVFQRE